MRKVGALSVLAVMALSLVQCAFGADSNRDEIVKLADIGQAALSQHRSDDAEAQYEKALDVAESSNDYVAAAALQSLIGEIYEAGNYYQKALGRYETALRILDNQNAAHDAQSLRAKPKLRLEGKGYEHGYGPPVSTDLYRGEIPNLCQLLVSPSPVETLRAILLTNAGNMYLHQNQFKQAEDLYERAIALVHGKDSLFERKIFVNLAWSSIKRDDPGADQRLAAVMTNLPSDPRPVEFRRAILAVGVRLREKREYPQAIKRMKQAVALYKEASDEVGYARGLAHLGSAYFEAGDLRNAQQSYSAATDVNRKPMDYETEWHAQAGLAKYYDLQGNAPEAVRHYGAYLDAVGWMASDFTTDQGKISFLEQHEKNFEEFARLAMRAGATPGFSGEARNAIERVRAKGLEDLFTSRAGSATVQPGSLTATYLRTGRENHSSAGEQVARGVYTMNASSRGESILNPEDVAESVGLKGASPPPATFLEYYVTRDRTAIFVKTAKNDVFSAIAMISDDSLDQLVAEYRHALEIDGLRGGLILRSKNGRTKRSVATTTPRTLSELERALYRLLISPVSQWLPTDSKETIVIVPHRALWILPFTALREKDGEYFGDQHVLTYAASEDTWRIPARHARPADQHGARIWIAGNPDMPPSHSACHERFSFKALPGAQEEAEAVAKLFRPEQVSLFTGAQADRLRLEAWHSEFTVLHLATHGFACLDDPLDSFVVLSQLRPGAVVLDNSKRRVSLSGDPRLPVTVDVEYEPEWNDLAQSPVLQNYPGILDARAVVNHFRMRADLVTLSACQTGVGKVLGQGSIGLTRAFMAVGARSILASLWRVDDDATRDLMISFYKGYLEHGNKGLALQNAIRQVRQEYPQPRYWAAFSLFGMAE